MKVTNITPRPMTIMAGGKPHAVAPGGTIDADFTDTEIAFMTAHPSAFKLDIPTSGETDPRIAELEAKVAELQAWIDAKNGTDLTDAIECLDDANDDHWTRGGEPSLAALQELTGNMSITRADANKANPRRRKE